MKPLNHYQEGGCACGAVRYRLLLEPLIVHACHCRNCQRQSGSLHAVNALIETHEVELLQGELDFRELPTPSGAGQTVARCAKCSVAVWSNYHIFSQQQGDIVRFIRVGTLDNPDTLPPDVHIFDADRNANTPVIDDAPRFAEYYELAATWSRPSLRRLYALFEPGTA